MNITNPEASNKNLSKNPKIKETAASLGLSISEKAFRALKKKAKNISKERSCSIREAYEIMAKESKFKDWHQMRDAITAPKAVPNTLALGIYAMPSLFINANKEEGEHHIESLLFIPKSAGIKASILVKLVKRLYMTQGHFLSFTDSNNNSVNLSPSIIIETNPELGEELSLPYKTSSSKTACTGSVFGHLHCYTDFKDEILLPTLLPVFAEDALANMGDDESDDDREKKKLRKAYKKCLTSHADGLLSLMKTDEYRYDGLEDEIDSFVSDALDGGVSSFVQLPSAKDRAFYSFLSGSYVSVFTNNGYHYSSEEVDAEGKIVTKSAYISSDEINMKGLSKFQAALEETEGKEEFFVKIENPENELEVSMALVTAFIISISAVSEASEDEAGEGWLEKGKRRKNIAQAAAEFSESKEFSELPDTFKTYLKKKLKRATDVEKKNQ